MAEKKKGFDLSAALGAVSNLDTVALGREQIEYIDPAYIKPDERNFYALDGIKELAANIEFAGLQQPIRLRPDPDAEGSYVILSGHRRFAALELLRKEDPQRWAAYPCIVEREAASGEAAAALQELKLILANSDTRKISSADLSRQAERVEMLLYELKKAGVEFPGRMRDHVAEACKVSKSKLARLKVIREGLVDEFLALWERGQLAESPAYVLAHFPKDFQPRLVKIFRTNSGGIGGFGIPSSSYLEIVLEHYNKGWRWEPCLTCPDGTACKRGDTFLKHDCDAGYHGLCGGNTCCLECGEAKTNCNPCARMCSKAKSQRKERKDAEEAAAKRRALNAAKGYRNTTATVAQRLLALVDAAGLEDPRLHLCRWGGTLTITDLRRWANGEFMDQESLYSPELDVDGFMGERIIETADLLGCSADYLLGRTDDPNPVPNLGTSPTWQTGTPPQAGKYYCKLDCGGAQLHEILTWDTEAQLWRLGELGAGVDAEVLAWYPLPPADTEEAEPHEP